ncbi:hypothetical protein QFC21_007186 [Naganishia friedmannii]|uniref:Uncharacterized protein n=1 Tax=Naganishia friedmannii TaxID=89922 RepID=A0ACC2UXY6_9TREE|nr:hypothetical protein QFC21_007186 [Naganishia friedmannii]
MSMPPTPAATQTVGAIHAQTNAAVHGDTIGPATGDTQEHPGQELGGQPSQQAAGDNDQPAPGVAQLPDNIIDVPSMGMVKKSLFDIAVAERNARMAIEKQLMDLRSGRTGPLSEGALSPGVTAAAAAAAQALGPPPGLTTPAISWPSGDQARIDRLEQMVLDLLEKRTASAAIAAPAVSAVRSNIVGPLGNAFYGTNTGDTPEESMELPREFFQRGKFAKILKLFEETKEKEMEQIMAGRLDPFDLWKCLPIAMRVSGDVADEAAVSVELGEGGSLKIKTKDETETRKKRLAKLLRYCPTPLAFINAWTWFIVLTQYWYEDASLAQDMLRFGWRIVKCNDKFYWHNCLEMFVDLASPILRRGRLKENSAQFEEAGFAEHMLTIRERTNLKMTATAVGRGTGSTSTAMQVGRSARIAGFCQNWNRGACNAGAFGRVCPRDHLCNFCEGNHPRFECADVPPKDNRTGNYRSSSQGATQANLQYHYQAMQMPAQVQQVPYGHQAYSGHSHMDSLNPFPPPQPHYSGAAYGGNANWQGSSASQARFGGNAKQGGGPSRGIKREAGGG